MVYCARRIFRTVLGSWTGKIIRCTVRRDIGNISIQFDGGRLLDSSHSVSLVLGPSTTIKRIVPTFFMPIGCFCRRFILYIRTYVELFCHQFISSVVYVRDPNRFELSYKLYLPSNLPTNAVIIP